MLIQYVRDENYNPIGCFIAELLDFGACYVGYSFFNSKKEVTPFNKKTAKAIAYDRMTKAETSKIRNYEFPYTKLWTTDAIPEHAASQYVRFIERCKKYYRPVEIRVY